MAMRQVILQEIVKHQLQCAETIDTILLCREVALKYSRTGR
jgi:hypothetical protein